MSNECVGDAFKEKKIVGLVCVCVCLCVSVSVCGHKCVRLSCSIGISIGILTGVIQCVGERDSDKVTEERREVIFFVLKLP